MPEQGRGVFPLLLGPCRGYRAKVVQMGVCDAGGSAGIVPSQLDGAVIGRLAPTSVGFASIAVRTARTALSHFSCSVGEGDAPHETNFAFHLAGVAIADAKSTRLTA